MNGLSVFELISMAGGLVGVYVKLNSELAKLKGRMMQLETSNDEVKTTLKELVTITTEIKLALARKGMDS